MTFEINSNILIESPEIDHDCYESEAKDFLKKFQKGEKSYLYGLIGPYGTGKSTMLEKIKRIKPNYIHRIHFDARQFPERKHLWDGFVIEFCKQMLGNIETQETEKKIAGQRTESEQITSNIVNHIFNNILSNLGLNIDISTVLETTNIPVSRIYEYQNLLKQILQKTEEKLGIHMKEGEEKPMIIIVLEDIDRSGSEGLFFLETLNHFLRGLNVGDHGIYEKIICICPIATSSFHKNIDKYLKVLDYYDFWSPIKQINEFVEKLLINCDDIEFKDLFRTICESFLNKRMPLSEELNFRELKFVIRNIYIKYETQKDCIEYPEIFFIINLLLFRKKHKQSGIINNFYFDRLTSAGDNIFGGNRTLKYQTITFLLNKTGIDKSFLSENTHIIMYNDTKDIGTHNMCISISSKYIIGS